MEGGKRRALRQRDRSAGTILWRRRQPPPPHSTGAATHANL